MTHVHRLAYSSLCLAAQPRSFRKDLFPLRANPVSMFHLCQVDLFSFLFSFARMCLKRKSEKTKIARPKINNQKCPPCGRTSNYRKSWAPRPQHGGAAETADRYLVLQHTMGSIEQGISDDVLGQLLYPEVIRNSSARSINHETT